MNMCSENKQKYNNAICLAFDYGTKRIGIAVGNSRLQTTQPLCVVVNRNGTPDWKTIDAQISDWEPTVLIVGWPLDHSGKETALCDHVRGFSTRLKKRYQLPVELADERYSSMAAQDEIRTLRQRGQMTRQSTHGDVDKMAAAFLLETWFSTHGTK
jgi:putative Holliday junction resolvase